MGEFWKIFGVEFRALFGRRKIVALLLLSPFLMSLFAVFVSSSVLSSVSGPVRVCAPSAYAGAVTEAGGVLVTGNCEVSIAAPTEFYFSVNLYENTARVEKAGDFAESFVEYYYFSAFSVSPSVTEKTVLVLGHRVLLINASPVDVMRNLFTVLTGFPVMLFITLLIGNEFVSTSFTSQREKRLLDIVSSYPLRRRNIILSKVAVGIVFGFLSLVVFVVGLVLSAAVLGTGGSGGSPTAGIGVDGFTVFLALLDTFLAIVFTYFVIAAVGFWAKDPSETSVVSMVVSSVLNFSLIMPSILGSFSPLRGGVLALAVPTLVPVQVLLFGLEGEKVLAVAYSLYLLVAVLLGYRLLMRMYERSFE